MTTPQSQLANPITLEGLVKRSAFADRFKEVLGAKAPQFISSLLSIGKTMPDVEPRSIIAAAMNAAVLDLPVDKNLGFAWIIPYRKGDQKLAQFQMGYKGFIQLALRSGAYAGMNACPVNEEVFTGWNDLGFAKLDWSKFDPEKPAVGYAFAFALANTPNCAWTFYWSRKRVEAHAQRYSQSYRSKKPDSPWVTNFDAQGVKTVVKNCLSRWGILSIDFQTALLKDQSVAIDVDAEVSHPDNDLLLGDGEESRDDSEEVAAPVQPEKPKKSKPLNPPVKKAPEPPPEPGQPTPQAQLASLVIGAGYTFDTFAKWGVESGNVPNCDSLPGFEAISDALAKRFLNAQTGLLDGLKRVALL